MNYEKINIAFKKKKNMLALTWIFCLFYLFLYIPTIYW